MKAKAEDIATTVTAAADVVSLAVVGKSTTLMVVGPDGKLKDSRTLASTFCRTGSISATAGTVYAIRSPCGRSQDPARLVAIARPSGAEAAVAGISGEPVNVLAREDRLVVVTRKSNGSLCCRRCPSHADGAGRAGDGRHCRPQSMSTERPGHRPSGVAACTTITLPGDAEENCCIFEIFALIMTVKAG